MLRQPAQSRRELEQCEFCSVVLGAEHALGDGPDAAPFAEFTYPIIEKRRGFPVIPLMTDIATINSPGTWRGRCHLKVRCDRYFAEPALARSCKISCSVSRES